MIPTDLVITPRDPLILRDGRPFGQLGSAQAGSLNWPRPGTVIGMARTVIGTLRNPDFFRTCDPNRIEDIRQVAMSAFLPASKNTHNQYSVFLPAPADAVGFPVSDEDNRIDFKRLITVSLNHDVEGTDIDWENFQYAWLNDPRKPAKNAPSFWKWDYYRQWLLEGIVSGPVDAAQIGLNPSEVEERTHVSIASTTGAAAESQIFTSMGIRFQQEIVIAARIDITENDQLPTADVATLGGDRRPALIEWGNCLVDWPEPPDGLGKGKGFRLILTTPGIFDGGWAPTWLIETIESGKFAEVPGKDVRIRLRSACIPRWLPCHGWDMTIGKDGAPKPMRKMVQAGAVYFVETDAADNTAAAESLWNISLCENEQARLDGFGRILVGNWIE
jgi:CRISPR-associated protein Cmr3